MGAVISLEAFRMRKRGVPLDAITDALLHPLWCSRCGRVRVEQRGPCETCTYELAIEEAHPGAVVTLSGRARKRIGEYNGCDCARCLRPLNACFALDAHGRPVHVDCPSADGWVRP